MESKEIIIKDGISLNIINTNNMFKTNTISISIVSDLKRETITSNALIALVLRRGSKKYPTMQDIAIKLEEMYGATFDANSSKVGNNHVMDFSMSFLLDEYTLDNYPLFEDAVDLMCNIILHPILENGVFKGEYVDKEKYTLKEIINSKINDKGSYASERAVEEMYKGDPFGIYRYGYIEDLEKITPQNLYEQYLNLLKNSKIYIYVAGNIDEEKVIKDFKDEFSGIERVEKKDEIIDALPITRLEDVIEHQNVFQGKIVMGYRLKNFDVIKDLYKMTLYSAILGGTASSKLFNNVREKKSLAYTIRSQYNKLKGAMFVTAGIELQNYEFAKECIFKEIDDMRKGNITQEELNDAKANLITGYKAINDSQNALIVWAFGQKMLNVDDDINNTIEMINAVSIEDVVEVANRLELVMIYYLCN